MEVAAVRTDSEEEHRLRQTHQVFDLGAHWVTVQVGAVFMIERIAQAPAPDLRFVNVAMWRWLQHLCASSGLRPGA